MNVAATEVIEKVRAAVEIEPRFRDQFEVLSEGFHQEGGYSFVQVKLRKYEPLRRRIEIYVGFAELESYLQAEKGLSVVLLPVYDPALVAAA